MVNTDRLKRELEKRGLTPVQAAWHLGISEQCFCRKMQSGRFGSQDMQLLTELMELQSPESIFFT